MAVHVTPMKSIKSKKIVLYQAKLRFVTPSSLELNFEQEDFSGGKYEVTITATDESVAGWQTDTHPRLHVLYSSKNKAQASRFYRKYAKRLEKGDYELLLDW